MCITLTNGLEYEHYNQLQGWPGVPQLLQVRHTSLMPLNAALLIASVSAAGKNHPPSVDWMLIIDND